jgi:FixJ family two-component response regulator
MSDVAPPTVFIVDDDPSVLKALDRILRSMGFTVETFDSPQSFLDKCDLGRAGCVLLDLSMPQVSGIEVQQRLVDAGSLLTVVFLSGTAEIPDSVSAMKAGAVDFLIKPANDETLRNAIAGALERNRRFREERDEREAIVRRYATLTAREKEVMRHLLAGKRNKQIAYELGIVEKTIKVHRARVLAKLQVTSLVNLYDLAARAGIEL